MNSKSYFCLNVESPLPLGEEFVAFINEFSPLGAWEVDAFNFKIYFRKRDDKAEKSIRERFPGLKVTPEPHEHRDWVKEYEENLSPIMIGERFAITHFPTRRKVKEIEFPGRMVLKLVPGEAFGTGEHFTTLSCVEMMEKISPFPATVLDVGTGTGILALAARKLGASLVHAFDNDPEACRVAKETVKLNGEKIRISCGTPDSFRGCYDLVIANILAETIIEISGRLDALTSPGGSVLLSGITLENGERVREVFQGLGFTLSRALSDAEWVTFLFAGKSRRKQ